ncbi:GRB10-interacting GYF protein 2 isoform X2 [Rhinoderma darwinii]|uniref:GRB10-interacting GYF protein 2 isoform X2 n=1 Tax=Rhinoderma darwinii TaxID=43563 RepID=UPI003F680695
MTAETQTLNFGPEWLRALSSGGSVISPPLSPALPKYKLADYRYGREEMLALYVKDNKVPSDLLDKEFLPILNEEPLLPLALVPFTEEEQRNFSMSVNSGAVLRLMGRGSGGGGGTVVGAPRGRSSSRGRGRGRGEGGFYQRSFDELESGFGRGAREMHRSQSWEERGDRRFEKPTRKEPDGARGPGWREHPDRRRRFDIREREDERGYRRTRSGSGGAEDERDSLPEWCLEDAEDETGTFDSSGAFLPSKKVQKESIPEEQELDFRPAFGGEEHADTDGSNLEDAKETEVVQVPEQARETSKNDHLGERPGTTPPEREHSTPSPAKKTEPKAVSPVQKSTTPPVSTNHEQEGKLHTNPSAPTPLICKEESASHGSRGSLDSTSPSIPQSSSPAFSQSTTAQHIKESPQGPSIHSPPTQTDISPGPCTSAVCAAPGMGSLIPEPDEEDGLEHLEQQAQQMVAYLQDGALDDERLPGKATVHRVKGHPPENQQKWYYKDPQGEIQGPFSNREMAEWYQAGYFPITLLLRRVCDEAFQPLGDIIKLWGRVPFITPPASRLAELAPEHIGRHQEMTALYQLQQLHYQQFLIQQQYAQVMAQQQKAALSSQQQQQLALLLQQFQALKMRISEQPVGPTLPRAMSVPENTSLWELQTAAPPPTMWEGSSVWDLPVESASQGPSREQLEKAKAAKIEQERRKAELRAKKQEEEEQQHRRLEEEERKRKEELELARRKQEEALRRQREQELAIRRQIEEEERKREEERRLLEEKRRQEEERRRQEEERRRLEEERKRIEEERRRKEEEKKREEEKRKKKQEEAARWAREEEEAAKRLLEEARLRQEEEEHKKREEAQRQKELQRQRQQQQEALRRLQQQQQQQQLAQMKLPSSSTWGQQVNSGGASQSTLSLAEIQKLEEERERQNQEEQRRQLQELKSMQQHQQQQQQQQQQQKTAGWGSVVKPTVNTQSLLEIQQEEARQMQKIQQQQQQAGRSRPANVTIPPAPAPVPNPCNSVNVSGNSVWGNLNNNLSPQWSTDSVSSIWSSPENKTSSGFWDDAVKVVAPRNAVNKNKSNASKSGVNSRQSKKVEQEEKLVRLFQGATKCADGFTQWCEQTLHALNSAHSLDVPTFVSFLREVESPYEVHDYVRAYLGDTPEAKDFSKQFLERRNKQNTTQQKPQEDSGWAVYQTSQSNSLQTTLETAQSAGRKKKKHKMVRADPSLLGFSVNASSDRLNMGEIETLEDY